MHKMSINRQVVEVTKNEAKEAHRIASMRTAGPERGLPAHIDPEGATTVFEFLIDAKVKDMALTVLEGFDTSNEKALQKLCEECLLPFDEFKLKRHAVAHSELVSYHTSKVKRTDFGFRVETYLERKDGTLKFVCACDFQTIGSFHIFGELGEESKAIKHLLPKDYALNSTLIALILCQIIARLDLIEKQTVDYSKLNKKRAKTGKPPLPTITRIVLKRSAEELANNAIQMHAVNAEPHIAERRRLHDVRSHIRLKNGKIEIVRAHKRGDASLGCVKQLRIVR